MAAAAALVHENIWVDKYRTEDAEYAYHQALANQRAGLVVQGVGLSVGVGVDSPEIQARLSAVEQENKDLKSITAILQATVAELTARVTALEKGAGIAAPAAAKPAAAPAAKKAAPADDDDEDDFDLFGSDDDEEEVAKLKEERVQATKAMKPKKTVIAKSSIVFDVKPWADDTDLVELEKQVRTIVMDGLLWGAAKLVPIAYGIKKLQISAVVEDEKVSTEDLETQITEFEEYVQSVDIAAFNKI